MRHDTAQSNNVMGGDHNICCETPNPRLAANINRESLELLVAAVQPPVRAPGLTPR